MKKRFLAFLGVVASPFAAFAQESSGGVDPNVASAITELKSTATAYAGQITPYVKDVAVAFLAITGVVVVVQILRWGLRKATPSAR